MALIKKILFICAGLFLCIGGLLAQPEAIKSIVFVVKSNVLLLNSKPSKSELDSLVRAVNFNSRAEKYAYLKGLCASPLYCKRMVEIFRDEYINNTSEKYIREFTDEYGYVITSMPDRDSCFLSRMHPIFSKLQLLNAVEYDFSSGKIDIQGVQRRFLDNHFYDEINMGEDNRVISTFQHLFMREPTGAELQEGKKILNYTTGYLLNKNGIGQEDFYNILFSSQAYREGQIRFWFNYLLDKNPHDDEMAKYMLPDKNFDVKELQVRILSDYL